MATITKKELIDRIADATDERRAAVKQTVQLFLDEIVAELAKGNRLEFRDFGVFETKVRKARRAQNPRKGVAVWVPQRTSVKFKLGRLMKLKLEALDEEMNTAAQGDAPPPDLSDPASHAGPRGRSSAGKSSSSNSGGTPPPAGG